MLQTAITHCHVVQLWPWNMRFPPSRVAWLFKKGVPHLACACFDKRHCYNMQICGTHVKIPTSEHMGSETHDVCVACKTIRAVHLCTYSCSCWRMQLHIQFLLLLFYYSSLSLMFIRPPLLWNKYFCPSTSFHIIYCQITFFLQSRQ